MKIKELVIKNYKSIKEIKIVNPNPFTVFVGANAAGKSNIFDCLEFYTTYSQNSSGDIIRLFGDVNNYNIPKKDVFYFNVAFENLTSKIDLNLDENGDPGSISSGFLKLNENQDKP